MPQSNKYMHFPATPPAPLRKPQHLTRRAKKHHTRTRTRKTHLLRAVGRRSSLVQLLEKARPVLDEVVDVLLVYVAKLFGAVAAHMKPAYMQTYGTRHKPRQGKAKGTRRNQKKQFQQLHVDACDRTLEVNRMCTGIHANARHGTRQKTTQRP